MSRTSVKALAKGALAQDVKLRSQLTRLAAKDGAPQSIGVTVDSFVNFQHKLGVGADNALSGASYGFNPITRNRNLLEWIHRGSWLGGVAVDVVANDMTRAGVELTGEFAPEDASRLHKAVTVHQVWPTINEGIRWGRLYGGAIVVALVDGHDLREPLRLEAVGQGSFKGLLTLDRWMVEPTLENLVTDLGPHLGLPKYYRVGTNAPALRGAVVHHSRVVMRPVGVELPYQQRLTENLWGLSVLERLYDRMIAFDSASTGMAQLVYKSYIRTLKIDGYREIVAQGGAAAAGLAAYVDMMRRFQGIEGMTVIDAKDDLDVQTAQSMTGMADALDRFAQQCAGALEVPLTRLLGLSGGGLNGTNDADLQLYYDSIYQKQEREVVGITNIYKLEAASLGLQLPPDFGIEFNSLQETPETEKGENATKAVDAVTKAMDAGLFGQKTGLKELRQQSRRTGYFTNITQAMIDAASDDASPPPGMGGELDPLTGLPMPSPPLGAGGPTEGAPNEQAGSEGQTSPMDASARRRAQLLGAPRPSGTPSGDDRPGPGA
jgi:uncharacterized protein